MSHNLVYTAEGESVLECRTMKAFYTKEDILGMLHDIEQYNNSTEILEAVEAWKLYEKNFGTYNHVVTEFK